MYVETFSIELDMLAFKNSLAPSKYGSQLSESNYFKVGGLASNNFNTTHNSGLCQKEYHNLFQRISTELLLRRKQY